MRLSFFVGEARGISCMCGASSTCNRLTNSRWVCQQRGQAFPENIHSDDVELELEIAAALNGATFSAVY
jgi:hypothetical protein